MLGGKKRNFNKAYFDELGEALKLNQKQINGVYKRLPLWLPKAQQLIQSSFLDEERKSDYTSLIAERTSMFSNLG